MKRLQLQLFFVLLAAISVATLSAVLISGAIRGAERFLIADTRKALAAANAELAQQYAYRVNADTSWRSLPMAAQDISLRAISQAVLRSYPGAEGGFFVDSKIFGYSYPTHGSGVPKVDVPVAELPQIKQAIQQARESGQGQQILRGSRDVVVIEAAAKGDHVCWTMKRLSGVLDPGEIRRNTLLSFLVIAALVSIIGTLATVIGLRRGIAEVQTGLGRLETDFAFQLPMIGGELGSISLSINRVAEARRALESELRREDRLRAIGRMAANIAHEIRNPLNSIRLTMQLLERRLANGQIQQGDLELVIREVDRLNALLGDLLAFRGSRKPELENQKLIPIIQRCMDVMQAQIQERKIEFQLHAEHPETSACFDAKQLIQVLTNLFLNSVEAISYEGAIEVSVYRNEHDVSIHIRDTGPGVVPEHREHLFEPFYTTREGGTGLGLAVSRELVVGMGGTLVYQEREQGASFVVTLPARKGTHENNSDC